MGASDRYCEIWKRKLKRMQPVSYQTKSWKTLRFTNLDRHLLAPSKNFSLRWNLLIVLIVLPKVSSLPDEQFSSQSDLYERVSERGNCFRIYMGTSIISQINLPNCHMPEVKLLKISFPPCQLSRRLMGEINILLLAKLISKVYCPLEIFWLNVIFPFKKWSDEYQWQ